MKKFTKIFAAVLITASFASCNNSKKKENTTLIQADTTRVKPIVKIDTIQIYRYEGVKAIINSTYISTCAESEKALLAYYAYLFSTACEDTKHCKLTEALGLGEQNSKAQQDLVKKWFNDTETTDLVKQGGAITPNGKETMAWFGSINLVKDGSAKIKVIYISHWIAGDKHGKGQGTDSYEIENNHIKVIARDYLDLDIQ